MMSRVHWVVALAGVALLTAATAPFAAEGDAPRWKNKVVKIGDAAPTFAGAIGVDGKTYGLDSFKDSKAVVVIFTCNKCPVAIEYEDRFSEFAKKYAEKGVSVVAINVHDNEQDGLEQMKIRAEQKGFTFPYAFDASQASARAYGATCTPHIFVLDGDRKIAYMGAFDDNRDPAKVSKPYVPAAIDSILAGKPVEITETEQKGCGIGYKKKA